MATPKTTRWQGALEAALARGLPAFLPGQRWFGAKARPIASARVEDTAWLRGGPEPCALAIARIDYASGTPERYALLLALRREPGAVPGLGAIEAAGERRHIVEGSVDSSGPVALLRHLGERHELQATHGGTLSFGDLQANGPGSLSPAALRSARVRPLGAEQSNTSYRVDPQHVFKLFRRVEPGENPEVEIGRFLTTRTSFRAVPALRGSVTWRPAGGPPGTIGALQDRIENVGDGWQWTLGRLREVLSLQAAPEPLANEILTLGVITADLHAALASGRSAPGFNPEPATPADVRAWEEAFRARAARVFEMVAAGMEGLDARTRGACEALLRMRGRIDAAAALPEPAGTGSFSKIRLHGDYHLGQTLKTGDGFVVIDFEGEPARPLAERKQLHSALKDVAGMLRSFDYAVESARALVPAGETWNAAPPPLREAFLQGYETRALELGGAFLPADADARTRSVRFFELDKALYELEYEIQNRPSWLHIPAAGILRLTGEAGS